MNIFQTTPDYTETVVPATDDMLYDKAFRKCLVDLANEVYGIHEPFIIAQKALRAACDFYDADWCGMFDVDMMLDLWMPFWWHNKKTGGMTQTQLKEGRVLGSFEMFRRMIVDNAEYYQSDIESILEVKQTQIHEKVSQSIRESGWLPNLFRTIVGKAKDFLQTLIREQSMPTKPTLDIDISEFRHMRSLMIKVQDRAKEIKHLQNNVLPKLQQQLADTKGIFKGKERKELESKIQQAEQKISKMLDELPDILKADGYPDVQAFMATFRKMEGVVEQYNRDLAKWEQQVREKEKPTRPPEKESVRDKLRQLQAQGKQERKPRKKFQDRDR